MAGLITQTDLLRAKMWVCARLKDEGNDSYHDGSLFGSHRPQRHPAWTGPYYIVETQLPLIIIEHEGRRSMVDASDYEFRRVDAKFAKALYADLWGAQDRLGVDSGKALTWDKLTPDGGKKRRQKKEKPPEAQCPVCQYPRRKRRLLKVDGLFRHVWYCPECGKNGQPVADL